VTTEAQDMSTPEARAAYFEQCWKLAAEAGNEARSALEAAHADRGRLRRCLDTHKDLIQGVMEIAGLTEIDNPSELLERVRSMASAEVEAREAGRILDQQITSLDDLAVVFRRAITAESALAPARAEVSRLAAEVERLTGALALAKQRADLAEKDQRAAEAERDAARAEAESDRADMERAEEWQADAEQECRNAAHAVALAERDAATLRGALGEVARRAALAITPAVTGLPASEKALAAAIAKCARLVVDHVAEPALALASEGPAAPCQHVLVAEEQKCRHGFFFGSTCEKCIAECAGCRTMFVAPAPQGETPAPVTITPEESRRLMEEGRSLRRELRARLAAGRRDNGLIRAQGETDAAPEARDPKRWHLCHHDILVKDCRACQEAGCCGAAPAPADPRKD
jgi:uncharacterized protein YdhG (YjbR/CyaY superfamily)